MFFNSLHSRLNFLADNCWLIFYMLLFIALSTGLVNAFIHVSEPAQVLGRYSRGYFLGLVIVVIFALAWIFVGLLHTRISALVIRLPGFIVRGMIFATLASIVIVSTLLNVQVQLITLINIHLIAVALFFTMLSNSARLSERNALLICVAIAMIFAVLMWLYSQFWRPYNPDEAIWASIATNYFYDRGIYFRQGGQPFFIIQPGLGYINLLYGWLLERISYSILTGRNFRFISMLLAIVFIGLGTRKLYGWRAAIASMLVALVGHFFFGTADYRPDHLLALGLAIAIYFSANGMMSNGRFAFGWDALAGFVIVSSLNIHAAAVGLAAGFSLYYLMNGVTKAAQTRTMNALKPMIAFGVGAATASSLYILLNILPIGGFSVYVGTLIAERYVATRTLRFLASSDFELILLLLTLLICVWRWNTSDRFVLRLFICCCIGIVLLDTQGYLVGYRPLFYIPVGGALLSRTARYSLSMRWTVFIIFIVGMVSFHLQRNIVQDVSLNIRKGTIFEHSVMFFAPTVYTNYVRETDHVVGPVELVWAFRGQQHRLLTETAEIGMMRSGLYNDPVEVWEEYDPTLIISLGGVPQPAGLQAYMATHNFERCISPQIADRSIVVYRKDCSGVN